MWGTKKGIITIGIPNKNNKYEYLWMVYLGKSIINSKVKIAGMKNISCLKNGVSNN